LWRIANQSKVTLDASARWERNYTETMSFWSDIAIIAQTPLTFVGWRRDR
jgi:lipopolysaccharide/colanic/teichoic acid biosynthesis glycosyltransferase